LDGGEVYLPGWVFLTRVGVFLLIFHITMQLCMPGHTLLSINYNKKLFWSKANSFGVSRKRQKSKKKRLVHKKKISDP
jgi:hypothetical protein